MTRGPAARFSVGAARGGRRTRARPPFQEPIASGSCGAESRDSRFVILPGRGLYLRHGATITFDRRCRSGLPDRRGRTGAAG